MGPQAPLGKCCEGKMLRTKTEPEAGALGPVFEGRRISREKRSEGTIVVRSVSRKNMKRGEYTGKKTFLYGHLTDLRVKLMPPLQQDEFQQHLKYNAGRLVEFRLFVCLILRRCPIPFSRHIEMVEAPRNGRN